LGNQKKVKLFRGKTLRKEKKRCSILIQKRGREHNSSPQEKKKSPHLKRLHNFPSWLGLKLSSGRVRWLLTGVGVALVCLSLWHVSIYYCANRFLTQGERDTEEQNPQKAIESFRKAIKLNPRLLDAYVGLAKVYLQEEKPSLAVDELLKASNFFPDDPTLLTTLAKAYEKELLQSSQVLKIGVCSKLNPLTSIRAMRPMLSSLSRNSKCRVSLVLFSGYESISQYLKEGRVDIAILGPEDLIRIKYQSGAIPLMLVSPNKQNIQRSIIVTSGKRGIRSIKDLKGKSFAFADRTSLTGYILPRTILLEEGIDPEKDFTRVYFMSSQEEVFLSLLEGKVDAGALAEHIFYYLSSIFHISGEVHILARSGEIPADILVVRKNMPPELTAKVKTLLTNYPESTSRDEGIFREYTGLSIIEEHADEGKTYTVIFAGF